mgnify:FL=1
MYRDLSELITPGFLSTSLDVDGHRYVLRSLSQNDLQFLHKYVRDDDPTWRLHLVAHSVWMADGVPLLEEATLAHRVVYDHLCRSSRVLFREMLGTVYGFFSRMREANFYLESYLYEEDSRRAWRGVGRGGYSLATKTAIPGVEKLGLNPLQSAWVSWNQMEDTRDDQEYIWSNTKVLVSLQSHKGYESLSNKDRQRAETEDGRRASVQDKAWRRFWYGDRPEENLKSGPSGEGVQKARTTDELEEEMRRWIRGEFDWHDTVVEAYKNRIRDEQDDRERQKAEIMAELRAKREAEERNLGVSTPRLRPITAEELAEMRGSLGPRSGAKFITEADPVSRTFNRYLRPTVQPGNLSVDSSGNIVEKPAVVEEQPSLADRVANRRVVLER